MANALEVLKRIVREEYKNIKDGVNIHPDGFRDYAPEEESDFDEPHSTEKMESVKEELLSENPAASAAAAMIMMQMQNPDTGKKVKAITPLKDKDHKLHNKAKGIFKRLKDKFSKKKEPRGTVHNYLPKDYKRESVNEFCGCENCHEGETCCSEMLNPPNYLDNVATTPINTPDGENLVNRGKRTKKSGQPKFGTFRNETITINGKKYKPRINQENVMKITKAQIREIIREELHSINEIKSGLTDDIKKFKTEYDVKHGKLKEKAMGLRERQQIMKAVRVVNEKIMGMIGELNKLPVTDALENVKKSHANKYIRAIETLKGICEQNAGWLKENQ